MNNLPLKKLFNYTEYHKIFEEFDVESLVSKNININMLDMFFENVDLEKLLVNSAQIISIISSFFGKIGLRVSLTLETLLFLYWIWKYNHATSADVKEDALIQLCFASFGFIALGATPAFKAISSTFAKGYKEYKLTGEVAKIHNLSEFKILQKNETALKKAASTIETTVKENLDKIPKELVSNTVKTEIKETSKGVKKYVDELFEAENKVKAPKGKLKGKIKTVGKVAKLSRKLFPIASYLLNRFLNKKKKPAHLEKAENDIVILQYSFDKKIIGADFPTDLNKNSSDREERNGKVIPTIVGLKVLIEDFDNKKVISDYNILTDKDTDFEYYMMCAINGEPIYNNFKLFAVKGETVMISKLVNENIEFVNPREIMKDIAYVKLISVDQADTITSKNYDKVFKTYHDNLEKITNSYTMWSKIVEKTFTMDWWNKNFKLKESE